MFFNGLLLSTPLVYDVFQSNVDWQMVPLGHLGDCRKGRGQWVLSRVHGELACLYRDFVRPINFIKVKSHRLIIHTGVVNRPFILRPLSFDRGTLQSHPLHLSGPCTLNESAEMLKRAQHGLALD